MLRLKRYLLDPVPIIILTSFAGNARIEFLRSIKFLGVTLDKDLSYKEHISDQLKKAYAKASALRRIGRFLPHDEMIKFYEAFILPHLEYCSPFLVGILAYVRVNATVSKMATVIFGEQ